MLIHIQTTRTSLELAACSPNFHTTPTGGLASALLLEILSCRRDIVKEKMEKSLVMWEEDNLQKRVPE
ncbi:hypothetical protein TNCV_2034611 [Trichonephila clavipes]|nr:hypothetical protein TNCV_2034611 [Trichonephila clavipes]